MTMRHDLDEEFQGLLVRAVENLEELLCLIESGQSTEEAWMVRDWTRMQLLGVGATPEHWERHRALVERLLECEHVLRETTRSLRDEAAKDLGNLSQRKQGASRYANS